MRRFPIRFIALVVLVAATAATASVWAAARSVDKGQSLSTSAAAALCKDAGQIAALNGEASPSAIEAVTTTRNDAVHVAQGQGEDVLSKEPVYLVQMQGGFTGYEASVPAGTNLPKGAVMAFTVSVDSGAVLDWGIAAAPADLSTLGPVSHPCAATQPAVR